MLPFRPQPQSQTLSPLPPLFSRSCRQKRERNKIIQHDKCHLCDKKQTLNHLFVSFSDVQTFWQGFSRWWNVKNDDFIDLNDETTIYGFTNDFSQQFGLNLCLIIAKYYIYCASRNGENYYFEAFLAFL